MIGFVSNHKNEVIMDCEKCRQQLPGYLGGSLPGETGIEVEKHLVSCRECMDQYRLLVLSARVMEEERNTEMNPFLSTRVMAGINAWEQMKEETQSVLSPVRKLKPLLIGFFIAAAIFAGNLIGNLYKFQPAAMPVPVEMAYMDDALIESTSLFDND